MQAAVARPLGWVVLTDVGMPYPELPGPICKGMRRPAYCAGRKRNVATLKPALGKQACTATCKASRQRAITGASPSSSAWALCRLEKMGGLPMYGEQGLGSHGRI